MPVDITSSEIKLSQLTIDVDKDWESRSITNIDNLETRSITIGANTIDTNEWAHIDGLDQDLKTVDSPTFAGLTIGTLSGILKASTGAVGTAVADTDYQQPITWGDGLQYIAPTASIDYNATNLKIDAGKLNTIQDIDTSASPTFAGLTINGNLSVTGIGTFDHIIENNPTLLLLDQSTPQTIVNGIPFLDKTFADFTDIQEIVNKDYVDTAVTSLGAAYYMTDSNSGEDSYKLCSLSPPTESETYIEAASLGDDDFIAGWISDVDEAPTKLLKGVYDWFIFLEKTTGTKTLRVYWKLFERKSDDSEVEVATSSESNEIDGKTSYVVPLSLDTDYIPDTGSRIVGKLYASVSGSGNAPTIRVYYRGTSGSRWEIPANTEIYQNIFIPYTGALHDVDLGSHSLAVSGATLSGLTAGSVLFAGTGGVISEDNSKLFWDSANTTLKVPTLQGTSSLAIKPATDSTTAIQLQTSDGTNILNVDTTKGMVGIGTDNPQSSLHIVGNIDCRRDGSYPNLYFYAYQDTIPYGAPRIAAYRARGSEASPSDITSGWYIFWYDIMGYNSTVNAASSHWQRAARLVAKSQGTYTDGEGYGYIKGQWEFSTTGTDGVTYEKLTLNPDSVIINNRGYNCDFYVKSDTNTKAIFVDASADAVAFACPTTAIADASMANNNISFYVDEATNTLYFKVKYSDGTVKSGSISLS